MLVTFDQLGTSLTRNATVAFSKGMKMVPSSGRSLFNTQYVQNKIVESDTWSFDQFARNTGEGNNYASSDPVKGFPLIHTQGKFTQSFETTKEMQMYDKYSVVGILGGIQGLGSANAKRLELNLQLHIGMGAGASYTDMDGNTISTLAADGQNIFSAVHTTRSGSSYSNLQAVAFSQAGLEAHELLFRSFPNHDGQQVRKIADTIYCTRKPALNNEIDRFLRSTVGPDQANRGVNVYEMRYKKLQMEFLDATSVGGVDTSKDDYWGLAVSGDEELQLKVSQDPIIHAPQMVIHNRNVLIQTDSHFSLGIRDAYCITLSNV